MNGKIENITEKLKNYSGKNIKIMEVCGTHTSVIHKAGIREILSPKINLVSGPGCPVCVTDESYIRYIEKLSEEKKIISFGDMSKLLNCQKEIVYSPFQAFEIAAENPHTDFIFVAVGFETTAPIYALMLDIISEKDIKNLQLITSVKRIIPAVEYICDNEKNIDAFICPGNVCAVIGSDPFAALAEKYKKPFIVTGFSSELILSSICKIADMNEKDEYGVFNFYDSVVSSGGNKKALGLIEKHFEISDGIFRGIGVIKNSELKIKNFDYVTDDYVKKADLNCSCTDIILGRKSPKDCPLFGEVCTPLKPVGPCMVSSEGACHILIGIA
ncbi:MAG: hydrogenase formation protein HypD [Ruminococcus sp.]|jgi:hydrogenase expression/formation protein HypD|nr:hydrogenase formation protein HypD [Ruminococcus sp.]